MSELKFECPHCKQHLSSEPKNSGRQIQCPNCNHLIRIPSVPGQTQAYKPESGQTWATYIPPGKAHPES